MFLEFVSKWKRKRSLGVRMGCVRSMVTISGMRGRMGMEDLWRDGFVICVAAFTWVLLVLWRNCCV